MKLWIKLTLLFTLLINIIIEIGLFYINPKIEEFSIDLVGEKLKSISASISAGIDGDQFKGLDFLDSNSLKSTTYKNLERTIKQAKKSLELPDELYTISILDKNGMVFGVVFNREDSLRNHFKEISSPVKTASGFVYENKQCEYTSRYNNSAGSWLSGLAPIFDPQRSVVGIIQIDQKFELVENKITTIISTINFGRLYLIPITILFSILFSVFFLSPITKLKQNIIKIANGNYSETSKIKSGGEIKELVDATETLRATILEQQSKIFNSMSELENSRDKAEASDRMKSEFLAVLSHEIRTPLNVILGNIEILKMELDETSISDVLEITDSIKYGSDRLIRTVEMIVLYSELASGSYNHSEKYININELYFDIVKSFENEASKRNIVLKTDCAATTGMIRTDEFLISETIKQIADNAVKYSKPDKEIVFCLFDKKESGLTLIIKDEGIGISEGFLKDIFKPFRQEDMRLERSFEGNGLGLALAKKCCDTNGFELKISSEKNIGTVVEIVIPKERLFNIS